MRNARGLFKVIAAILTFTVMMTALPIFTISAASDYPSQQIRITAQNGKNLNITGYSDNSALNVWTSNGSANERWTLIKVSGGFKIVNTSTGRLVSTKDFATTNGTQCVLFGDANDGSQVWSFVGIDKDSYGNYINYKIVNGKNSSLALTLDGSSIKLSSYSGSSSQKWKVNSDGLEGFGANCTTMAGGEKAGVIGGLFGDVVYASSISDLQNYLTDSTERTVVVNGNIESSDQQLLLTIGANKTLIGSYGSSVNNVLFQTGSSSKNFIFKNLNLKHDVEYNQRNVVYLANGANYWIDHCTFEGHDLSKDTAVHEGDIDKLLNIRDTADYVTVSYCKFTGHKYGLLFGYPNDDLATIRTYNGYPRLTFAYNYLNDVVTRGPGLMRHGYFHMLNNYVVNFDMAYTIHTNSRVYSESSYFEAGTRKGSVVNDDASAFFTDVDSYPTLSNIKSYATDFRPASYYQYTTLSTSQVPSFTKSYSGVQNSKSNVNYINYNSAGVPSAGKVTTSSGSSSSSSQTLVDGAKYMIKNKNSGLYLEVEGGKNSSGANVQQWGANGSSAHNTWIAVSVGDGYYKFVSCLGNKDKVLDIAAGSKSSGANVQIWGYGGGAHQQFKPVKNSDGSYAICTRITGDKSGLDVAAGSKSSGANVQQWTYTGGSHQQWYFEKVS